MSTKARSLFDPAIVVPALGDSVKKLNPAVMIKNPVMFVTMVGAAVTTAEIFVSHGAEGLHGPDLPLALVHGSLRQFRRGDGGGTRQSAGERVARNRARNTVANRWRKDGSLGAGRRLDPCARAM